MFTNFLETLGSKLAERWAATVFTPAFFFWAGGLGAAVWHFGWDYLRAWFMLQDQVIQLGLLVSSLLAVLVSGILVQRLDLVVIRILEGYWPNITFIRSLRKRLISRQYTRSERMETRFQDLSGKGFRGELSLEEKWEQSMLNQRLRGFPDEQQYFTATDLGNLLRAAELRPLSKYGLDSVICWSRLWLLLSDSVKNELVNARATLDTGARIWPWSILFLVWTIWAWWAPLVAIVVAFFAYRWMLSAAQIYGDLVEATFDLYRIKLYESLRLRPPNKPSEELQCGRELTQYLWIGPDSESSGRYTG